MHLLLPEQATHHAQAVIPRRGDAQLVAVHRVAILALDELGRIDQVAGVVDDVRAVAGQRVVPERIVAVVAFFLLVALEMRVRVDQVEVADLALHGQGGLNPAVVGVLRIEMREGQVADLRIGSDIAVGDRLLPHDGGADRPVIVDVELQRRASAADVDIVVVVLGGSGAHQGRRLRAAMRIADRDAGGRERARTDFVVDVAGIMFVPTDQANGRAGRHRYVDHALGGIANAAVIDRIDASAVAGGKTAGVGFVGDDAERAGLRAGAVQRALRTGQRLDAGDVVHVDVERAPESS